MTMAFGNIVAISQRNVKRMLAYSSIAHTGYMMVGLAAYQLHRRLSGARRRRRRPATAASPACSIYLLAYTFMNIGAFAVVDLGAAPRARA